ncbi:MAG: glycosyltransferase family 9 protein [Fusobacteriaceae bacterium]
MKILIVRFRQIGDAIISSVLCNTLKKSFPGCQIDYVLYDFVAPIFQNHPYIDNLIVITPEERKNPFRYIKKAWDVTRTDYDVVIDLMSTPKSEVFSLFSRAKFRIGRAGDKERLIRGKGYNYRVGWSGKSPDETWKTLDMLKPLQDAGYEIQYDNRYCLRITEAEKSAMREKMKDSGVDFSKKILIGAVNSRRPEKVYPVELMVEVFRKILEKNDVQIVLFYSKDEKQFVEDFHQTLDSDPRIITGIETKDIRELGALMTNCNLFFGNEGGPRHMAQALDLPTFAVFGPKTFKDTWLTNGDDKNRGLEPRDVAGDNFENLSHREKYELITPDMIYSEIEYLLKKYVETEER